VSYAGDANNNSAHDPGGTAEQTVATAIAQSLAGNGLILNQTAEQSLHVSGNAAFNVNGTLQVDSNNAHGAHLDGNAVVKATQTNIVGGDQLSGHAQFVGPVTTHAASVADPFAFLAALSYTSGSEIDLSGNQTLTINPGTFSSINVSGHAQLTMMPGTYIIGSGGFTVSGGATVTGTKVLVYNTGALNVSGNASVNLTAPTAGEYAGMAIFQDRNDAAGVTISGNAELNLHGSFLYDADTQSVDTVSGNATVEASLNVDELNISGNGIITT
jgi:hypothetical protein